MPVAAVFKRFWVLPFSEGGIYLKIKFPARLGTSSTLCATTSIFLIVHRLVLPCNVRLIHDLHVLTGLIVFGPLLLCLCDSQVNVDVVCFKGSSFKGDHGDGRVEPPKLV